MTVTRLIPDVQQLSRQERDKLLRLCDEAVETYTGRRGRNLYDHRRIALGDISGTARYEVLKRAGFRCDLCGISAEERALEVDHILPRRQRLSISNLQALCYKCNANKAADQYDTPVVRGASDLGSPARLTASVRLRRKSSSARRTFGAHAWSVCCLLQFDAAPSPAGLLGRICVNFALTTC